MVSEAATEELGRRMPHGLGARDPHAYQTLCTEDSEAVCCWNCKFAPVQAYLSGAIGSAASLFFPEAREVACGKLVLSALTANSAISTRAEQFTEHTHVYAELASPKHFSYPHT